MYGVYLVFEYYEWIILVHFNASYMMAFYISTCLSVRDIFSIWLANYKS